LRGLQPWFATKPGVPLAKPRCTPGFTLSPTSRAATWFATKPGVPLGKPRFTPGFTLSPAPRAKAAQQGLLLFLSVSIREIRGCFTTHYSLLHFEDPRSRDHGPGFVRFGH